MQHSVFIMRLFLGQGGVILKSICSTLLHMPFIQTQVKCINLLHNICLHWVYCKSYLCENCEWSTEIKVSSIAEDLYRSPYVSKSHMGSAAMSLPRYQCINVLSFHAEDRSQVYTLKHKKNLNNVSLFTIIIN